MQRKALGRGDFMLTLSPMSRDSWVALLPVCFQVPRVVQGSINGEITSNSFGAALKYCGCRVVPCSLISSRTSTNSRIRIKFAKCLQTPPKIFFQPCNGLKRSSNKSTNCHCPLEGTPLTVEWPGGGHSSSLGHFGLSLVSRCPSVYWHFRATTLRR